jgi:NDP-sugar pyrophosphorylase family protein
MNVSSVARGEVDRWPGVTAIVLAGGSGSRFGEISAILPKALLTISPDETLLSRLLNQLTAAGIDDIVISTSEQYAGVMKAVVEAYLRSTNAAPEQLSVRVFVNSGHASGPGAALASAVNQCGDVDILLCLSDIYFACNPFHDLRRAIRDSSPKVSVLAVDSLRTGVGGIVSTRQGRVERLLYRPTAAQPARLRSSRRYNWTGTALMARSAAGVLGRTVGDRGEPLEECLNRMLDAAHDFVVVRVGRFINVNSYNDLLRCRRTEFVQRRFGPR